MSRATSSFAAIVVSAVSFTVVTFPVGCDEQATGPYDIRRLSASDATRPFAIGGRISLSESVAATAKKYSQRSCPPVEEPLSGSAFVFRKDNATWAVESVLTPTDAAGGEVVVYNVAVSGDVAVVLSLDSAFVFRRDGSTWLQKQALLLPDPIYRSAPLSLSGDVFAVGDFPEESVYVYRFDGSSWLAEETLSANENVDDRFFGGSLAISGNTMIVGARGDSQSTGSVYIFRYEGATWVEEQRLVGSDTTPGARFGRSVAIDGDIAIVGSSGNTDGCPAEETTCRYGSAYLYRRGEATWSEEQKLTPPEMEEVRRFGYFVALDDNIAVVGNQRRWVAVYSYYSAAWHEEERLKLSSADGLIESLDVSVGSSVEVAVGFFSGSAYVYDLCGGNLGCGAVQEVPTLAPDLEEAGQLLLTFDVLGDGSPPRSDSLASDPYAEFGVRIRDMGGGAGPSFSSARYYHWPATGYFLFDGQVGPLSDSIPDGIEFVFDKLAVAVEADVGLAVGYSMELVAFDSAGSVLTSVTGQSPSDDCSQYGGRLRVVDVQGRIASVQFQQFNTSVGTFVDNLRISWVTENGNLKQEDDSQSRDNQ